MTDNTITRLKSSSDVDLDRVAAAIREAADGCRDGNCRRFKAEDDLWTVTDTKTMDGLLRALADNVQSTACRVTSLNYAEYIAVEKPVEERLELFVDYPKYGELHLSVTYVPTTTEIEVYDD